MFPWLDRRGRFSALRAAALALLALPALQLAWRAATGGLGADPLDEAINHSGTWALRILLVSLALTPLRRLGAPARLMELRRMVGVAAFLYVAGHLLLYAGHQAFDLWKIGSEIALRLYLTIGFAAFLGLAALAASSTDGMVRRLGGRRWKRLHRVAYALAVLGIVHAWMQAQLQGYVEPLVLAGVLGWLFALRWLVPRAGPVGVGRALPLALACAALTAAGEALFLHLWLGAPPLAVLAAHADTAAGIRPAWIVLALTVPPALLPLRGRLPAMPFRPLTSARAGTAPAPAPRR